jgi:hypothetical protein
MKICNSKLGPWAYRPHSPCPYISHFNVAKPLSSASQGLPKQYPHETLFLAFFDGTTLPAHSNLPKQLVTYIVGEVPLYVIYSPTVERQSD